MKTSTYKSYDELPLFLNAKAVAEALGIAPSSAYELMHEPDFPTMKVGNRIIVPTAICSIEYCPSAVAWNTTLGD